jgi:hypothetical protein
MPDIKNTIRKPAVWIKKTLKSAYYTGHIFLDRNE